MKQSLHISSLLVLCLSLIVQHAHAQTKKIELQNGDSVLFVGDGLFENELDYGYLEYVLTTAWPNAEITFRNIGWSGDTPAGTSRDHFTNPPTAHDHLIEQIKSTNPSVAFVGYGAHMAFEKEASLDGFMEELHALVDTLQTMDVRVVMVSPAPHVPSASPSPMAKQYNEQLAVVSKRIKETAVERELGFVDLYEGLLMHANQPDSQISDNGIHLNDLGYAIAGIILDGCINSPQRNYNLNLDVKQSTHSSQDTTAQSGR